MSRTIYHFTLNIQGEVSHGYYGSLEALILDNWEELTVSRSTLQKHFAVKENREYSDDNWTIYRGKLNTTGEVRKYREALDNVTLEDFETDLNDQ